MDRKDAEKRGPDRRQALNSTAVRFGMVALIVAALSTAIQVALWSKSSSDDAPWALEVLIAGMLVLLQAGIVGFAAAKLARNVDALREATEAIASGEFDSPLKVDCSCEVGALAQSFQKLVDRLNFNLRQSNLRAHSDILTGLPTRTVITHLVDRLVIAREEGAVLFFDLDGFRRINELFGHHAGDQLLCDIALRIATDVFKECVEDFDRGLDSFGQFEDRLPHDVTFARFTADQFVVLLPGEAGAANSELVAHEILRSLDKPFMLAGTELKVTARMGLLRLPEPTVEATDVLKFAELAMRAAEDERGRIACISEALRKDAVQRGIIERDIVQAVERRQFFLHYQPQVDSRTGDVVGVEALLRWNHATLGLVSPAEFIPIAEQIGLMPSLGRFVIEAALQQCAQWQRGGKARRVAINVSATQFDEPQFVDEVLAFIARYDVEPSLVEIEITESSAMSNAPLTRDHIFRLRAAGLHLAVDDFGTGYSNLAQLARLPFTTLKIDRSLIGENSIVGTIVDLASRLAISVVAEGIETGKQAAMLASIHCTIHQGFLYARPMSPEALDAWEIGRSREAIGLENGTRALTTPTPNTHGLSRIEMPAA